MSRTYYSWLEFLKGCFLHRDCHPLKIRQAVSIAQECLKLRGLFVNIRLMYEALLGFLLQVGSLMRLFRLQVSLKTDKEPLFASTLKSPIIIKLS